MSPPTTRRWLFRLLSAALVLVAVELGAGLLLAITRHRLVTLSDLAALRAQRTSPEPEIAIPGATDEAWLEQRIAIVPALHPYLGFVSNRAEDPGGQRPGFSVEAMQYGFPLNTRDLFAEHGPDDLVVGVFGGSFAAGFSGSKKRVTPVLAAVPRFAGRNLAVMTFAVAGHKQPQQLMALNYLLSLGVRLDVVVNLDGFNEIALAPTTNVPFGYSAFYPRGWPLLVGGLDRDARRAIGELTYLRELRAARARSFSGAPWRYSLTAGAVWLAQDAALGERILRSEKALDAAEKNAATSFQATGPIRTWVDDDAMVRDLVALWQQSSLQMHVLCRGLGIEYLHVLQPNQYLEGSKPMGPEERRTAWKDDQPYREAVQKAYPLLREAGEELRRSGVAFVDLTQVYAAVEKPLYVDTCCHVNAEGYRRVAAAIAEALARGPSSSG